ncbi:hypothetical protein FSP39_006019 [Pinctada imbricata]|uniref:Tryptophan synthase beta chain-like PALP domain-containing protein n=1 Tax=Pinctada imbricata TaxID=66713 RepID=A0AA89BLL2_PINIB|nr:hypothetical protein FSP39_006019 [Pinctada imbricata]
MTFSSGNHGQGLAWAAHLCNLTCTVVVPRGTPKVKTDAIQGDEICAEFNKPDDVAYIPGSDDIHVIAGQGTIALEFLQQVPYLDAIFVATGSGGVIAGVAVAAKSINPQIKSKRLWSSPPQLIETIADGIRAQPIVKSAWPIVLRMVEKDVFTVSDEEIIQGMRFSLERMKLLTEPATGATIAAVMSEKMKTLDPNIRNIGVILCGGNTDVENLPWLTRFVYILISYVLLWILTTHVEIF